MSLTIKLVKSENLFVWYADHEGSIFTNVTDTGTCFEVTAKDYAKLFSNPLNVEQDRSVRYSDAVIVPKQ